MSFNKKFFTTGGIVASSGVCNTDTADIFGDGNGVALYNLDYDASDASGNYDGTPTDVTFGVGGQINYGARFNGSTSTIDVDATATTPIDFSSEVFSVSLWIKVNSLSHENTFLGKYGVTADATTHRSINIKVNTSGQFVVTENDGSSIYTQTSTATISANTYTFFAYTRSGSTSKIYINDNSAEPQSRTNTIKNGSTQELTIGGLRSGVTDLDGDLDQVRIFSSTLTDAQVSTLYAEEACVYTSTTDQINYPTDNVAYYKLDGSAEDSHGNTYDGTASNITYEFGRFGQAAVFNGTDSALDTNVTISGTADYSCSLWVNIEDDSTRNALISLYTGTGNNSTVLYAPLSASPAVDEWRLVSKNTNELTGPTIKYGQWQHVVLTYDHSITTFTLYIDGVSVGTSVASSATGQDLIIGALNTSGATSTKGLIDQVRIYSTELTPDQVTELYNEKQDYITKDAADPFGDTSEFAFYKFDNNANDSSGSNNGTVSGATFSTTDPVRGTHNIHFDGINDKVDGFSEPVFFDRQSYSASIWVKPDSATGSARFMSEEDTGGSAVMIRPEQIIIDARDANTNNATTDILRLYYTLTAGIWNHICLVNDALHYYLYLNGDLITDSNFGKYPTSAAANVEEFGFGARVKSSDAYFGGEIDHTRLFNRALDGTEVYQLYAEGARGTGL